MKKILTAFALSALSATTALSDSLIYAYNDTGEHRIHIKNLETGEDRIVTPAGGAAWNATFSPDGKHFVYTWQADGNSHVFIAPTAGGEHKQLTHGKLTAFHPSFSPDGSQVVFSDWTNRGVAIMNVDGTNRHLFAESEQSESHPVFFQDGKHILFNSYRERSENGDPAIFTYDVETGEVSNTGYYGTYARPSHDGEWVVFAGKREKDADRDIMIGKLGAERGLVPLSTGGATAITFGGGYDGHPAFTPDDKSIVFVSRRAQSPAFPEEEESDTAGTNEVFIMDRHGKHITRLTNGGAVAWHPEIFHGDLPRRHDTPINER